MASAKQQFNKIKSNIQQPAKAANFVMTGEGKRDAIAICSWPDKNGHQQRYCELSFGMISKSDETFTITQK